MITSFVVSERGGKNNDKISVKNLLMFLYDLRKKIIEKTKGKKGIFLFFNRRRMNIYIRWWTVYFGIDDDNDVETSLLTE